MRTPHGISRHSRMRQRKVILRRVSLVGSGASLILLGIVSVPSPVPIGFVLFAMGLFMMAKGSRTARRSIKHLRRRVPLFSRGLNHAKHRLPSQMRDFIEKSDPEA
ncbi:MAG TPA: hypothetical protein VM661_19240 [Candidatus Sulfotelmatobacter sp.]|jgi:hypothetical protein|nr:hypothetical protein [Candidatus Sulfotelmatobacter sp.]